MLMRYHEIASGMRVPISMEEHAVLTKISDHGTAAAALTDERDQEVACGLLRRGLLNSSRDSKGATVYTRSTINDIWLDRNF
jgi:hypothetical protein